MKPDFEVLRDIPILQVAEFLHINLVRTGTDTYALREEREITSLVIFEKTNTWKRFSGKEYGGVSQGSPIDLVMHVCECSLEQAIEFLTSTFL